MGIAHFLLFNRYNVEFSFKLIVNHFVTNFGKERFGAVLYIELRTVYQGSSYATDLFPSVLIVASKSISFVLSLIVRLPFT